MRRIYEASGKSLRGSTKPGQLHAAILADMMDYTGMNPDMIQQRARVALCRSEAIRYVQIGSPEMIRIDDGTIANQFFLPGAAEQLGIK